MFKMPKWIRRELNFCLDRIEKEGGRSKMWKTVIRGMREGFEARHFVHISYYLVDEKTVVDALAEGMANQLEHGDHLTIAERLKGQMPREELVAIRSATQKCLTQLVLEIRAIRVT